MLTYRSKASFDLKICQQRCKNLYLSNKINILNKHQKQLEVKEILNFIFGRLFQIKLI